MTNPTQPTADEAFNTQLLALDQALAATSEHLSAMVGGATLDTIVEIHGYASLKCALITSRMALLNTYKLLRSTRTPHKPPKRTHAKPKPDTETTS